MTSLDSSWNYVAEIITLYKKRIIIIIIIIKMKIDNESNFVRNYLVRGGQQSCRELI